MMLLSTLALLKGPHANEMPHLLTTTYLPEPEELVARIFGI